MVKIKKSEYILLSRTLIRKLYDETCFGKGSLYSDNLKKGIPNEHLNKVETVLNALINQNLCGKKKKKYGWKYFLNIKRLDKIREIIREKGEKSIIISLITL